MPSPSKPPASEAAHLANKVVESASGTAIAMLLSLVGMCLVVCWILARTFKELVVESERARHSRSLREESDHMFDKRSVGEAFADAALPPPVRKTFPTPWPTRVRYGQYGMLPPNEAIDPTPLKPFRDCFHDGELVTRS